MSIEKDKKVKILYTNYRGETSYRDIVPIKIWYGSTDWHKEEQWLLDGHDQGKDALRNFAMKDIKEWITVK
ncbi:WYL domain-containing protein [Agarilytica rhodophyticola]|uniref:WYL domain-containing protein n=1 Tax=Agarilytica rhodophyticola TaxID=1737490 RepID=UPI000B344DAC|nr:WYL domain-containing protein [Agarilytica rhodophyticola]